MSTPHPLADDATIVPEGDHTARSRPLTGSRELPRGAMVGRYVLLDRVGIGGMGTVYAAYDPQLDRRVAVKVLGGERKIDTVGRQRMLREAQAMARLTHPNVVAVHDSGEHDGGTFIAMEFIQGRTMKAWLREASRPWREVLRLYCAAGRGLAAAHAAGLVHRDFKPDNVMLADDGRVLVTDFGLARASIDAAIRSSDGASAKSVVQTAGFLGTPAYMAPEQFHGVGLGPWTDQFSFCVALYEGLWSERPFVGDTVSALATSVTLGTPQAPSRSGVPGWVRQAVLRGLANSPQQRHASMDALLAVLERDPSRLRRGALAAVVVTGAIAGSFAIGKLVDPTLRRCESGSAAIDDAWSRQRATRISTAFESTSSPGAMDRWAEIEPRLQRWADAWRSEFIEACAATHVRGEQSDMRLDLRMRCLADRRARFDALLDELESVDGPLVSRAAAATQAVPDPSTCADVDRADFVGKRGGPSVSGDAATAAQQLAVAKARNDAGRYLQGVDAADAAIAALGEADDAALRGEILLTKAQLQHRGGNAAGAESTIHDALAVVVPAALHDLAVRAWVEMIYVVGSELARPKEALPLELPARLELAAAGDDPNLTRRLEGVLGTVLEDAGEIDRALTHHEAAVALLDGAPPQAAVVVYANYGNALFAAGRYAEALEAHQRAYDLSLSQLGPGHPFLATDALNLARDLEQTDQIDRARELYRSALEMREAALGPDALATGEALVNLAGFELGQLRFDAAEESAQRALGIFAAVLGPDHPHLAVAHNALGNIARVRKQPGKALEHHAQVERIYTAAYGPDHPKVAVALGNRGNALNDLRDYAGAIEVFDRAIAIELAKLGPEHPTLAYDYVGKAEALLELGRAAEALPLAERAVALRAREAVGSDELAIALFCLARATWDSAKTDDDRRRAVELGHDAVEGARTAGIPDGERDATYEVWVRDKQAALDQGAAVTTTR